MTRRKRKRGKTQRETTREILEGEGVVITVKERKLPDEYGIEPAPPIAAVPLHESSIVTYPAEWAQGKYGGRLCWGTVRETVEPWRERIVTPDRIELFRGAELRLPGIWTEEIVTAWLAEAMDTLSKMGGGIIGPSGLESSHIDVVRNATEAYGYRRASVVVHPTAEQITRYDYAMPDWLLFLDDPADRKIVCGVAMGLSLRSIGREVGLSHETVRHRWKAAIALITLRLNQRVDKTARN